MGIIIQEDDLASEEVRLLITEHLAGMHSNSPSGQAHAFAIERLQEEHVTFWVARENGVLCGCGALQALDARTGEVKSMRTRTAFLRHGVGQALLDEIIRVARQRGYTRLFLETGTGEAFEPAHALYRRNGFQPCGPFGGYLATDFNVFMIKTLAGE